MNNKSETKNATLKSKLFKAILFIVYPAYMIHSLVTSPIYTVLYSDAAVDKIFPVLIYFLNVFIDLFVFWTSLAVVLYGLCHIRFREMRSVFLLALFAIPFKYALKMIVSPFVDGIPSIDVLILDIYSIGVSCIFEMLQIAVVILIMHRTTSLYREKRVTVLKAAERLAINDEPETISLLPFKKLFDMKNPLQLGALVSTVVLTIMRILNLAISDINHKWIISGINQYLTFFSSYVAELTVGALGYFLMLYMFILLYTKTKNN